MGRVTMQVSGRDDSPMATIWDADILIWAVSRLVAARRRGVPVSPRVQGSMSEVLSFIGRDPAATRYERL
ncbi:replication initiator protein A, partial [Novacetimonas hansenii]